LADFERNAAAAYAILAVDFASALVESDFARAHTMLSAAERGRSSADHLRRSYEGMIEYGGAPATDVELITTLDDWTDREVDDLGWAYVAICGDGYSEAVTVIVAQENRVPVIRAIEWGRP